MSHLIKDLRGTMSARNTYLSDFEEAFGLPLRGSCQGHLEVTYINIGKSYLGQEFQEKMCLKRGLVLH